MTHCFVHIFLVPDGPPVSLYAHPTNSTMVTLTWTEPPYPQRNGVITGYSVKMCQIDPGGSCSMPLNNGAKTFLVITSLHPYYEYNWRVAAHTSLGRGPYSSYSSFQMPGGNEKS